MQDSEENGGIKPATVTLSHVAARAGVSKMTASRALSETSHAPLRPETRARIEAAARDLGYARDPLAGGLSGAATGIVAILVPDLTNAVFADIIAGIQDGLAETEKQTIVARTGFEPEEEFAAIQRLLRWRPDALVLAGPSRDPRTVALLRSQKIVTVEVMDIPADPIHLAVGFRHADAGRLAAEHLHSTGYRRPATLVASISDTRARVRTGAFSARFHELSGWTAPQIDSDRDAGIGTGRDLCASLLAREDQIDCVFAANDLLASGAYIECVARGVRVPNNLAICGFNDLPIAATLLEGLTTIHSPRRLIGLKAADLIQKYGTVLTGNKIVTVDCHLEWRGTT